MAVLRLLKSKLFGRYLVKRETQGELYKTLTSGMMLGSAQISVKGNKKPGTGSKEDEGNGQVQQTLGGLGITQRT